VKTFSADAPVFVPGGSECAGGASGSTAPAVATDTQDETGGGDADWPSLGAARLAPPRKARPAAGATNNGTATKAVPPPPPGSGALGEASELLDAALLAADVSKFQSGYQDLGQVSQYYCDSHAWAMDCPDEETFFTPVPLADREDEEKGALDQEAAELPTEAAEMRVQSRLKVEQRRLTWEIRNTDTGPLEEGVASLCDLPQGQCIESPAFWVAGVFLKLAFYPAGALHAEEGMCAVALVAEEKQQLKFEVFLNGRTSGRKAMMGKKFACDFRRPAALATDQGSALVGVEVHENWNYVGRF